jgi:hypothetical protein
MEKCFPMHPISPVSFQSSLRPNFSQTTRRCCLYQRVVDCLKQIWKFLKKIFCCCFCLQKKISPSQDLFSTHLARFDRPSAALAGNSIYVLPNDQGLDRTRHILSQQARLASRSLHIGCAGFYNFDVIAQRRSTYGLIIDTNRNYGDFFRKVTNLILETSSRHQFVDRFVKWLSSLKRAEREPFFLPFIKGSLVEHLRQELNRAGSWLSSDEHYRYIREDIVQKGRLTVITENMTRANTCQAIRDTVDKHGVVIDTVYTCNITDFLATLSQQSLFDQSVARLLQPNSVWIYCEQVHGARGHSWLEQRVAECSCESAGGRGPRFYQ